LVPISSSSSRRGRRRRSAAAVEQTPLGGKDELRDRSSYIGMQDSVSIFSALEDCEVSHRVALFVFWRVPPTGLAELEEEIIYLRTHT
jgi:hypothetical protein